MNDLVFQMYEKIISFLSDDEKTVFKMGFSLGISEGTARCTDKLNEMNKGEKKCK